MDQGCKDHTNYKYYSYLGLVNLLTEKSEMLITERLINLNLKRDNLGLSLKNSNYKRMMRLLATKEIRK